MQRSLKAQLKTTVSSSPAGTTRSLAKKRKITEEEHEEPSQDPFREVDVPADSESEKESESSTSTSETKSLDVSEESDFNRSQTPHVKKRRRVSEAAASAQTASSKRKARTEQKKYEKGTWSKDSGII